MWAPGDRGDQEEALSGLTPRGISVAGLGRRVVAALIDAVPFAAIYLLQQVVLLVSGGDAAALATTIFGSVLGLIYFGYLWWAYATQGAGVGARLTGLRLVSLTDGEPIGWGRWLLRQVIYVALMATVIGGIALIVSIVVNGRRQGWHDLAAGAVLVRIEPQPTTGVDGSIIGFHSTPAPAVGNPTTFAPDPEPPAWLPGIETHPLGVPSPKSPDVPATQWSPAATRLSQRTPRSLDPASPGRTLGSSFLPPTADTPPQSGPRPTPQWIPLPTPSSVIEPSRSPVRVQERGFGEVDEEDGTRLSPLVRPAGARRGDEGWFVRLDDGREVDLTVTVLLGRNPHKREGDPAEVNLVPASGDGRMISRTHVLIGTDLRGVYIVDRGSTNGTALVTAGGQLEPCPADTQVRVQLGQQVSYGNRWFTVLRRAVD